MITDCGIAAFRKEIQAQASKLEYAYWAYREEARILGSKYAGMSTESEFRLGMLLGSGEATKLMKLAIALHERYPLLLGCMRDGLVDQYRAQQAHEVLSALSVADAVKADAEIAQRVREDGERPYAWRDYCRRVGPCHDFRVSHG